MTSMIDWFWFEIDGKAWAIWGGQIPFYEKLYNAKYLCPCLVSTDLLGEETT